MATGVELTGTDRVASGIVLSFPVNDDTASSSSSSQPPKVPRRLRRRLLEPKIPSTAEEIEAKLRGAHLRRQQYYELLSSKARPKSRSPQRSSSSRQGDLSQRLEAKLNAAEQKRLSILAKVQMRLARLDELRQAAKTGVEMRFEKERDELGMKVESRVQQAEANRMLLLKASRQRRLAKREQAAKLLMQKMIQDSKYKECVRAAILRKRTTAEKKRLGLLEAEKTKAHAMVSQVQRVSKSIYTQREFERMRMKDQLEDRLQRKGNTSTKRKGSKAFEPSKELARSPVKLSRYPVRVVLCAYMILGFLDTVISGNGVHEAALAESAAKFTHDFELLIKIILEGAEEKTTIPCQITFRSQLEAFVKAWCSYLYHFVVWKVKHAKSLEEDLVRAACQLELSMVQTCKLIPEREDNGAILKQVTEDRELLRTKVQHLSGNAGLERMEFALSDMRSRFLKAKDSGSSSATPFPSISSSAHGEMNNMAEGCESSSPIVHSLSKRDDSSLGKVVGSSNDLNGSAHGHPSFDAMFVGETELLVNEIVHEHRHSFADSFIINDEDKNSLNEKVRETMERLFGMV